MLHHVNPPHYAPLLMQVVVFEKKLLAWICTPPVTFTLDGLAAAFGNDDQAKWLWKRIEWGGKQTAFGKLVKKAVDYIQRNPSAGPRVVQCAQNDLDFYQHFTDTGFSFYERRFPAGALTTVDLGAFNPVLVGLYEKIFDDTGFPAAIHQDATVGNLTRAKWNQDFWDSNPSLRFCPACNGQRPSIVRKSRASDVDHFFPKEKYPFLSVHPDNLIPTCLECNTKAHRDFDPLGDHATETLLDTFHPYHCPAIDHIELRVDFKTGKSITVAIQEHNGARSNRVSNLVRVFDLETRWADWFETFIYSRIPTMRKLSLTSQTDVRRFLQNDLENNQDPYRLTQDKCFVFASILQYVLNDPQEFESFCAVLGL